MCKCTPNIRTPFCGKPGCEWPEQRSSNTLLPCPFCGGKAGIHRSHDADGMLWVGVRCQGCGAASTQDWCSPGNDCPIFYEGIRNSWNRRPAHEPTSAQVSKERLAQALRNLRDVAHREVSPRYSAALDEAFTLADIALGEFDSEGEVSREADVGPGGGVRATHATGSAPSKPGAAEPPSAGVKCTHCNGNGYNEPIYDEQDGWTDETPCETCNGSGRITTVEQYLKTLPANWHEDSSLETWFPITAEELKRLKDERASQPPSDDLAFPLDARVREVFGQTEGTIVAIDARYEVECTDGKHRFYWHGQLERVAETKDAPPPPPQPPPKRVIGEYAPGFRPRDADETSPVPVTTWKPAANGLCEHCGLSWFLHIVEDEQGRKDVCTSLAALGKEESNG